MSSMRRFARYTGAAAVDVLGSADALGEQAATLRAKVDYFLAEIRRA